MLVLLRRVPIANVAPATGFTVFADQYDTEARRPYRSAFQALTNTGPNAPFELTLGVLVPGASFCVNQTQRQVKYAGDGKVSTRDVPNAPACASSLGGLALLPTATTTLYTQDGAINVTWGGGLGSLRVRCALLSPAVEGTPPYYSEQVLPAGTQAALFAAPSAAPSAPTEARFRRLQTNAPQPLGLAPGRYRVEVLEEVGGMLAGEVTLLSTHRLTTDAAIDPNAPAGTTLLALRLRPQANNQAELSASWYEPFSGRVSRSVLSVNATGFAAINYRLPLGSAAAEVGNITTVFSNGQGGVSFVNGDASSPRLELTNVIYFHPDRAGAAAGGVVVEVHSFAGRTAGAVAFALLSATGVRLATNATGRFGGLAADTYTVRATLGAATLDVPVTLTARYKLKWRLRFVDVRVNKPCRLELWARGYTGAVQDLKGQAEPVTLETEGFAGGNTQPDLPAVIGSSATLRLRTAPGALAELLVDDRAGRADVYYEEELVFTGYLQPDIYEEAAVGSTVEVELTATDGLAALRDVDFAGHMGQELRGRWPVLHTLLHCLSRTDLALPLAFFTNRRALEMSSDEQPETDLRTDRLAYAADGKPLDLRAVVEALAQQQGGTLVQRNGRWELRAALEAAAPAQGRTYDAAGDHANTETAPAPAGRLTPERVAKADISGTHPLYWQNADQRRQRRAGWRFLTATGDATYTANALRQGDYFSDPTFWDSSGTALLPQAGWVPGEPNALLPTAFPLRLVEAGGNSEELATSWPVAASATDSRYLESELAPLAAGREGLPIEISASAKFYSGASAELADDIFKQLQAWLWVEVMGLAEGSILLHTSGAVLAFSAVRGFTDGFTTAKARLVLPVLPGTAAVRVRIHPFTHYSPLRAREGAAPPVLLLQSVQIQVLPQGASWKAADAYYASGAGGSVRPAGLEVFHVDAPTKAGLFSGVAYAFRRTVTRGAADNPATQWARADDLKPAPLLASAVLDTLALRANPSQVLAGSVRHTRRPPEILDSLDSPYDAPGRRFAVGARSWAMKAGETEVSLVEIGEGEHLVLPTLPPRVRLLHGLAGGRVRIRLRRLGIRAIHP